MNVLAFCLLLVVLATCYAHGNFLQLPRAPITCTTTEECESYTTGSVCSDTTGACECPTDTILSSDKTRCLTSALGYGAACEDPAQCSEALSTGGTCVDGLCQCVSGYHYLKGRCWRNQGLAQECFQEEQCYDSYESIGFLCTAEQTCACRQGYYERSTYGCRKTLAAGETCYLPTDCWCGTTPGKCESRKCVCEGMDEKVKVNIRRGIPLVGKIWEPPVDGKCNPGYFLLDGTCVPELGTDCITNEECLAGVKMSACVERKCSCTSVFIASPSNRECVKGALGDVEDIATAPCQEEVACAVFGRGATCNLATKKCKCSEGTHWDTEGKLCWPSSSLEETCTADKDCYVEGGSFAFCKDAHCSCKEGHHPVNGGTDCRADALHEGDPCAENQDCMFDHSICTDLVCRCEEHYASTDAGTCRAGVGSSCVDDTECSHMSNTQCLAEGEEEGPKTCQCNEGFVSSTDWSGCLKVANYMENCLETGQCNIAMGDMRSCIDGVCQCEETAHSTQGVCYITKRLGEDCKKKSECWTGDEVTNAMCQNGKCVCQYGFQRTEDDKCIIVEE